MESKKNATRTKKIVYTALFAALIFVVGYLIKIPTPTAGYIHPADAVLVLAASMLGPGLGLIAAAIGSALTDLIGGYFVYVPATLIIKGIMGLVCGLLVYRANGSRLRIILGAVLAEAIMVVGYFAFEATFLGYGLGAVSSVPGNILQGVFGAVVGVLLYFALRKRKLF